MTARGRLARRRSPHALHPCNHPVFQFAWNLVRTSPAVDDSMLRNAAKSASDGDWLTYGLTSGEMRFSPLKMIDASNVKRLGMVWSTELGDGGGDQEATPLVWNNTIFVVTNWSIVFAIDARTGKEKWRWDPLGEPQAHQRQDVLRRREPRIGAVSQ